MGMKRRPGPVSQAEIEILIGIEEWIRQRWRIHNKLARQMLPQILAGAPIEKGQHTVGFRRIATGGQHGAWLTINGRRALPAMRFLLGPGRGGVSRFWKTHPGVSPLIFQNCISLGFFSVKGMFLLEPIDS
jgi:hypothetical protein